MKNNVKFIFSLNFKINILIFLTMAFTGVVISFLLLSEIYGVAVEKQEVFTEKKKELIRSVNKVVLNTVSRQGETEDALKSLPLFEQSKAASFKVWILDRAKQSLVFSSDSSFANDLSGLKSVEGEVVLQKIEQMVQSGSEGFFHYFHSTGNKTEERIAFINYLSSREWVIVVDSGYDEFNSIVAGNRTRLYKNIGLSFLIILFLGLLTVLITGFFLKGRLIEPIERFSLAMEKMGENNLTYRMPEKDKVRSDEIGEIARGYEKTLLKLHDIITADFRTNAEALFMASGELSKNSNDMSESAEQIKIRSDSLTSQAEISGTKTESIATATEEASNNVIMITQSVEKLKDDIDIISQAASRTFENTSTTTKNVNRISSEVDIVASAIERISSTLSVISTHTTEAQSISTSANKKVQNTMSAISSLQEVSNTIGKITKLIGSIAEETNMLALNATIEAASAGKAGKGFAVVASEIKNLALQTTKANSETALQIDQAQETIAIVSDSIHKVSKVIGDLLELSQSIALSVNEQSRASKEVTQSIESIAEALQGTVKSTQKTDKEVKEITDSTSEAAIQAKESYQKLVTAADRLKEIVTSNVENTISLGKVFRTITNFIYEAQNVASSAFTIKGNSDNLNQMASLLKNTVSNFQIHKDQEAEDKIDFF